MGQINEALCKILCHNLCDLVRVIHELDVEPTFSGTGWTSTPRKTSLRTLGVTTGRFSRP